MSAAQPHAVHIKPVATQRNRVNVEACVPASRSATAQAAARVLETASRNVRVTVAPADTSDCRSSMACGGNAAVFGSPGGPLDVAHIRAFHPYLRAAVPGLDVILVSPAAGRTDASVQTPLLSARRNRDRSMVEYACRYAQRLNRKRVTVMPGPLASASRAPAWFASVAAQFPDLTLDRVPVDKALGRLASGDTTFDVLVVPAGFFSSMSAVAAGLSGAPELATRASIGADELTFSVGNAVDGGNGSPAILEGLLLSATQLLVHSGQATAALQVTNAVLKTLEDGLHSDGLKLLNPYTRRLDDDSLASAIIERLGRRPTHLKAACSEPAGPATRRQDLKLRVVTNT